MIIVLGAPHSWRRLVKNSVRKSILFVENCVNRATAGKLSTRRIQIFWVYFCLGNILKVILNNFQNNAQTKIAPQDSDSPRRIP